MPPSFPLAAQRLPILWKRSAANEVRDTPSPGRKPDGVIGESSVYLLVIYGVNEGLDNREIFAVCSLNLRVQAKIFEGYIFDVNQ